MPTTRQLTVLHLTWTPITTYGGIQTQVKGLIRHLPKCNVSVVHRTLPSSLISPEQSIREGRLSLDSLIDALHAVVREEQIDLIHAHNLHCHEREPRAVARVVAAASAVSLPLLNTIHDVGPLDELTSRGESLRDTLAESWMVTTSEFNQEQLLAANIAHLPHIIPPGVDFGFYEAIPAAPAKALCYPARLDPEKGALQTIKAIDAMSSDGEVTTVILSERGRSAAGETTAYSAELEDAIRQTRKTKVFFLDQLPPSENIYSRATISLSFPKLNEGFGLAPLESIVSLRPIVCSPKGGMRWARGLPGAYMLDELTSSGLEQAITEIDENLETWRSACRASRELLREAHDLKFIARNYSHLYRSIC